MSSSVLTRLGNIYNAFGVAKNAFATALSNKGVSANGNESLSNLVAKIGNIKTGTDYRLVFGASIVCNEGVVTGNKGAKVRFTKSFNVPYAALGASSYDDCILLFAMATIVFTSGSSGVTNTSTELPEILPITTLLRNVSGITATSFATLKNYAARTTGTNNSVASYEGAAFFAPATGSYSSSNGMTFSTAIPHYTLGASSSYFPYYYSSDMAKIYVYFMTANASLDYECTAAVLQCPIWAVKIT
jgi:hypothetical protein